MTRFDIRINGYNPSEVFIIDPEDREVPRVYRITTSTGNYMLDIDDNGYFAYIPNDYLEEGFAIVYNNTKPITLAEFLADHDLENIIDIEIS